MTLSKTELRELEKKVVSLAARDYSTFCRYALQFENQAFHEYMANLVGKHRRVSYDAPIEHGKTGQSIARILFELGRNPNHLMALVSATPDLPRRSLGVVRRHIQENERLARVFPHLKLKENTKYSITVDRPMGVAKDASVVAIGIEGNILGRRWTWLITDDVLRFQTTWTAHMRDVIWKRLTSEVFGRLVAEAHHLDIGTPWVVSDARHKMRRIPGYLFVRFNGETGEATDINGKLIRKFEGGLWPKQWRDPVTGILYGWPKERIARAKVEMPGFEFSRQIACVALSEAMAIFGNHLDACMELGRGIAMREERIGNIRIAWRPPEPHMRFIFTGVDLAIDKGSTANDTVFFTGAPEDRNKHILEIRRGKMEGPSILRSMVEIVRRYGASHRAFRVESNQGQAFILQFAQEPGLLESLGASPEEAAQIRDGVFPHATTGNKHSSSIGVRSMALDFERGRWIIPTDDDRVPCELVSEWVEGLKSFDPVGHTEDSVVASWLFSEQARELGMGGSSSWERFGIFVP